MGITRRREKAVFEPRKAGLLSGSGCLVGFCAIFILVGSGILWWLTGVPVMRWQEAQEWVETPCTILMSEVVEHKGDDGNTYSILIAYAYEWEGIPHKSHRYDFVGGSSSGWSAKQAVVDQYPPGLETVCYVNPAAPDEAVLTREFRRGYLVGLFGLIFIGVGLLILIMGIARNRNPPGAAEISSTAPGTVAGVESGALALKPDGSPLAKLIMAAVFAVIWNGVVGFIFFSDIADGVDFFEALFMLPFAAVGVVVIGFTIHSALALGNPRFEATLTPGTPRLGGQFELIWTITGSAHRVKRLRVWLQGQEEAKYRRGTDTVTDRHVFEKHLIAETEDTRDMLTGRVAFQIPEFTMHSFESANNKIEWSIRIEGEIPRWPDVEETFTISILPLSPGGR